mgnify:CR=1 FL=1
MWPTSAAASTRAARPATRVLRVENHGNLPLEVRELRIGEQTEHVEVQTEERVAREQAEAPRLRHPLAAATAARTIIRIAEMGAVLGSIAAAVRTSAHDGSGPTHAGRLMDARLHTAVSSLVAAAPAPQLRSLVPGPAPTSPKDSVARFLPALPV